MSAKQHTLRFTPGYMAIIMVGALAASPAWAQTAVTAPQPKAKAVAAPAKATAQKGTVLSDITVDGLE
ncbi:MAG: hypothetical protein QMB48_03445, partial [Burkholderiaceae bacterium]